MASTEAIELATEFQQSYQLDPNNTEESIYHDLLHSVTGLSVSLEDEELVLNIAEVLSGGECNSVHTERVSLLISLIPDHFLIELSNFYYG